MRLLLDTNALIWALGPARELPEPVRRLIADPRNDVFFSAVSIFEIAAKRAAARRSAPRLSSGRASDLAQRAGFRQVVMTAEHAVAVETLAPFHDDPFDKLLLAQAQVEDMRLVTHDEELAAFDSKTILF